MFESAPGAGKLDGRLFPASTFTSPIPFPPRSSLLSLLTAMEEKQTKPGQLLNPETEDREVWAFFRATEEAACKESVSWVRSC